VQILVEQFFSEGGQADLSNINEEESAHIMLDIPSAVTAEQLEQTINRLSNGKASGLDGILNEVLKGVALWNDLGQSLFDRHFLIFWVSVQA